MGLFRKKKAQPNRKILTTTVDGQLIHIIDLEEIVGIVEDGDERVIVLRSGFTVRLRMSAEQRQRILELFVNYCNEREG